MKSCCYRRRVAFLLVVLSSAVAVTAGWAQAPAPTSALAREPACQSLTPAAVGGPMPKDPAVMVLRWLGTAAHELVYQDQVMLLDAYYERGPRLARVRPLGFKREDVKRATAIFVGHGHFDHVGDAPFVAERTGARVFGGPPTAEWLRSVKLPERQIVAVKGGEVDEFKGLVVESILAHHSAGDPSGPRVGTRPNEAAALAVRAAVGAVWGEPTEAERKAEEEVWARGTFDPRISEEGTIAFLFSLANGFRVLYLDSAGPITEGERRVMQRIGRVDVAIVAYQGRPLVQEQVRVTMGLAQLFNPRVFIPTHHDEVVPGTFFFLPTEPLLMAIRDELPETRGIAPLYRTPICIDTKTGEVFVGDRAK